MSAGTSGRRTILVLAASPRDWKRLPPSDPEERKIEEAVESSDFKFVSSTASRLAELKADLDKYKPAIFHFTGHGSTAEQMLFLDETDLAVPADIDALANLLGRYEGVFLNACFSASQAEAIVRCGAAWAIGMTNRISTDVALTLAASFYTNLARGEAVRDAFLSAMRDIGATAAASAAPRLFRGKPPELTVTVDKGTRRSWKLSEPKEGGSYQTSDVDLSVKTVELVQRLLNPPHKQLTLKEDRATLGQHLFNILFVPSSPAKKGRSAVEGRPVIEVLKENCERVRDHKDESLRIALTFPEADKELARLPWECLYVPQKAHEEWPETGFFLVAQERISLTRMRLPSAALEPREPPLTILVIDTREAGGACASGDDAAWHRDIDVAKEGKHFLVPPTREALKAKLRDKNARFHVIHFVGHGQTDKGVTSLSLPSGGTDPDSQWLAVEKLQGDLTNCGARLLFLHAATPESYDAFVLAASRLVSKNLPAVVAMEHDDQMSEFAKRFYECLGKNGGHIDFALSESRETLGENLSPVLFLQSLSPIVGEGGPAPSATKSEATGRHIALAPLPQPNLSSAQPGTTTAEAHQDTQNVGSPEGP